jgi:aldose 1-epimerase
MRFAIAHRTVNNLPLTILIDRETETEVAIIPSRGALLHSFQVKTQQGPFNIIDNYPSKEELEKNQTGSHKSSKLSPFVCRIKEGKYGFAGKDFEFEKKFPDGSAIHGLIFDKPFEATDEIASETSASVTLQYHYKKDDPAYPFHYTCFVKYQLKKDGLLQVETALLNNGKEPIPIADGWHPYFMLGGKSDEWELNFHASQMLEFDEKLIPTGRLLPNAKFTKTERIANSSIDNCFLLDDSNTQPACTLRNPNNGWTLNFFPDKHYPYLQIYTPPHRQSIAIENLSGAPDCFNNKMGLTILEPSHSQTFTVGYQFLQ